MKRNNHKSILVILLLILLVIVNSSCSTGNKEKIKKNEAAESQKLDWQNKIKKTAVSDKTQSEKADEVSLLASSYQPSEEEVQEFEEDMMEEFTKDRYLSDLKNHEYMLTNLFKCSVVESFYDDQEQKPIDKFAYDFFQNTNYTYRGSMTAESEEIKLNEEQMNKLLSEIK